MNIYLIDFNDSFTLNIASELYAIDVNVSVINFRNFFCEKFINSKKIDDGQGIKIILGPGPGHPSDYLKDGDIKFYFDMIMKNERNMIIGICLGHQLIGQFLGYQIIASLHKYHGRSVGYYVEKNDPCFGSSLYEKEIRLQRYNSLTLKSGPSQKMLNLKHFIGRDKNDEIACLKYKNFLSYQFHPESIGTFYRKQIFLYIKECLYNGLDGHSNKCQRNL